MSLNLKPGKDEKPTENRDEKGRFLIGHKAAGPGRPKGSRHKLTEELLEALQKDFSKHGAKAIVEMREEKPSDYVKCLVSLVPKDVNLNVNNFEELSDAQLIAKVQELRAALDFIPTGPGESAGGGGRAGGDSAETRH